MSLYLKAQQVSDKLKLTPEEAREVKAKLAEKWGSNGPELVNKFLDNQIQKQEFFQALNITLGVSVKPPQTKPIVSSVRQKDQWPAEQESATTKPNPADFKEENWGHATNTADTAQPNRKKRTTSSSGPKARTASPGKKGKKFDFRETLRETLSNLKSFDVQSMLTGKNKRITIIVVIIIVALIFALWWYWPLISFYLFGSGTTSSPNYNTPPELSAPAPSPTNAIENLPSNAFQEVPLEGPLEALLEVPLEGPPVAPQVHEAVDAGSAPWKGNSQWLQIATIILIPLLQIIDLGQKIREIKEDIQRGNTKTVRLVTIWIAPILVLLGTLMLVIPNTFEIIMFGADKRLAIVWAIFFWVMAYFLSEGDPSIPAAGPALVALWHLVTIRKTGALLTVFKVSPDSSVYNIGRTFDLMTLNQFDTAMLSLIIYLLLIFGAVLIFIDLTQSVEKDNWKTFVGIAVAIIGGGALFAAGTYWEPSTSFIVLLVAGFLGQAVDVDKFDEALLGGVIFGSFLTVAFATPLA